MANKVKYGLKNVYYALLSISSSGVASYGTPVRIPGAVSLTLDAQGDTTVFYADDIAYWTSSTNNGYSGNLEVAMIPDAFRKDVLGEAEDASTGVLVENATVETKPFALLYQMTGDQKSIMRLLYNCTCSRAGEGGSTVSNSRTPKTDSISITASPLPNGNVKAKTSENTPDSVRNGWFSSVWQPASA